MALTPLQEVVCLVPERAGQCLLDTEGSLIRVDTPEQLEQKVKSGEIRWHTGTLRGVWPTVKTLP